MKKFLLLFSLLVIFSLYADSPSIESPSPEVQKQVEPLPFPGENSPEIAHQETSFTMQLLHMLTTLGLLIALILFASWVLKRMMRTRIQQVNISSAIKILEQRALTTKTVVSLIEIRGKEFAIAESANGVTLLGQLGSSSDADLFTIKKNDN